ncbi:MAG: hypothetical protein HGA85_06140 [Nanoarchaeota archaeon]|nr:hypothetical protein [Nanoarchaeota archaeon]
MKELEKDAAFFDTSSWKEGDKKMQRLEEYLDYLHSFTLCDVSGFKNIQLSKPVKRLLYPLMLEDPIQVDWLEQVEFYGGRHNIGGFCEYAEGNYWKVMFGGRWKSGENYYGELGGCGAILYHNGLPFMLFKGKSRNTGIAISQPLFDKTSGKVMLVPGGLYRPCEERLITEEYNSKPIAFSSIEVNALCNNNKFELNPGRMPRYSQVHLSQEEFFEKLIILRKSYHERNAQPYYNLALKLARLVEPILKEDIRNYTRIK